MRRLFKELHPFLLKEPFASQFPWLSALSWLLELPLLALVFFLVLWARLPAGVLAGFGLIAAALLFRALNLPSAGSCAKGVPLAALWIGSLVIWISALQGRLSCDVFYAALAGLLATAVWVASWRVLPGIWKSRWDAAVMVWLACGALLWLAAGYFQNQRGPFFAGLLATVAVLSLCRRWFRWGLVSIQLWNSLILLLLGLPVADAFLRPASRVVIRPETFHLFYSCDAAQGNPRTYARWKDYYVSQADDFLRQVTMPDPLAGLPFRLRPGAHASLLACPVSINSLGFRGPEFSPRKNGVYRIVALGESTTFGITIQPTDRPWPELLEQMIRERLKLSRPVQVINAGVPSYTICDNLLRLSRDILPLHPDMIISLHGANGFDLIDKNMLPPLGPPAPVYRERPVQLAAEAEFRLRMILFRWHALRSVASAPLPPARPLETRYAAAYQQLIQCARTNGIRLVLANYCMTINSKSDRKVLDFYGGGGSRVVAEFLRANPIHSLIVRQLAAQNPEVCFVDTHPHLDGEHEKFIDLLHYTQEGRRQMAENMFAGLRKTLAHDLAPP